MPELTGTSELGGYLRILWRWKLLFLFFLVATPVVAYLVERSQTPVYQSSALVGVNQTTVNTSVLNGGGSFSTTNVTAIARLVTTSPVANVAADLMHPPANAGQIVGEVTAVGNTATNFLTITATDRSAARAAAIANAFAHAISTNLRVNATSQLNSAIRGIRAQLAQKGSHGANGVTLRQQLDQLRAARSTQGSEAAILQAATPSSSPAGLNTRRAVEIGLVLGLLLGFGAVLLAENADRRLRTPGDLEEMTAIPLLAAVAPSAFSKHLDTGETDEEAFHMLRTGLMVFNPEKRLQSVLVTSAGEKEGKTTIAVRLARASAGAGLNVILIDADVRRAQVERRLGIQVESGLGAVLMGERSLAESIVEVPIESTRGGRLTVLPAGPTPPSPSALLASDTMRRLVREAEAHSDLVIVDTPAALAVSDPLPLMAVVSGVVLVARMNRSSRGTVRRLQGVIEAAGGVPVGVVATGVSTSLGYEHYSPKYYTHANGNGNGNGNGSRFRRRGQPVGTASGAGGAPGAGGDPGSGGAPGPFS